MTIETAKFAVQRGGNVFGPLHYSVSGEDIGDKLADGDELVVMIMTIISHSMPVACWWVHSKSTAATFVWILCS